MTLKTFSAMSTHVMNICAKMIEIAPLNTELSRVTRQLTTDRRTPDGWRYGIFYTQKRLPGVDFSMAKAKKYHHLFPSYPCLFVLSETEPFLLLHREHGTGYRRS